MFMAPCGIVIMFMAPCGIVIMFMAPCGIVIMFYYINPNKMHMLQSLFYLTTALHVSVVTITHLVLCS